MKISRKVSFRTILALFCAVCGFLTLELSLEIVEQSRFRSESEGSAPSIAPGEASPDSKEGLWKVKGKSYRKNSSLEMGDVTIRINGRGFRTPDYDVPKPEGYLRIVCIGGSTTFAGVRNQYTYPALVQKMLRERLMTKDIEIINCGISGLTSRGQLEKLPDYLAQDPDLILEYCGANDVCWLLFRKWKKEAGAWKTLARKSRILNRCFSSLATPSEARIRSDIREGLISNLGAIHEGFESENIDMILSTFGYPDLAQCTPTQRDFYDRDLKTTWRGEFLTIETYCRIMELVNEEIIAFGKAHSLPVIPLAEELDGGWNLFQDICHLTQNGILVKADIFSQHLEPVVAERLRGVRSQ